MSDWTPEVKRAAVEILEEMNQAARREDANKPHVIIVFDPVVPKSYSAVGPFPDRATAEAAAVARRAELNEGNTDTPFEVYVARYFEVKQ